jgi:hypothetical protein
MPTQKQRLRMQPLFFIPNRHGLTVL